MIIFVILSFLRLRPVKITLSTKSLAFTACLGILYYNFVRFNLFLGTAAFAQLYPPSLNIIRFILIEYRYLRTRTLSLR